MSSAGSDEVKKLRYSFKFTAFVTREVEFPDNCEEGSDEYERILQNAAENIDVDRHAVWEDAQEARDGD